MPAQSRLGDLTLGVGSHGLPCCPHVLHGVRVTGSENVFVNNKNASRALVDIAVHDCPHCLVNMCLCGSSNVFINKKPAHRKTDAETEFCGFGTTITGSETVFDNG